MRLGRSPPYSFSLIKRAPTMDSGSAWIAIGTAVFGALWTSGGRAALQRRVIQHELELSDLLIEGHLKDAMRQQAENRAAIYLARHMTSDARFKWLAMKALMLGLGGVAATLSHAINGAWRAEVGQILSATTGLMGFALIGAALGAIFDEMFRDARAGLGALRVAQARRRIGSK